MLFLLYLLFSCLALFFSIVVFIYLIFWQDYNNTRSQPFALPQKLGLSSFNRLGSSKKVPFIRIWLSAQPLSYYPHSTLTNQSFFCFIFILPWSALINRQNILPILVDFRKIFLGAMLLAASYDNLVIKRFTQS